MSEENRHLSPLELDVLQLSGGAEARGHLAGCRICQARLASRREQDEAFDRQRLPRLLARLSERTAPRRRYAWAALALGASVATVLVLASIRRPSLPVSDGPAEDLGIKGWQPALRVVVRRGGEVFEAHDGDHLAAGDALRFVVARPPGEHLLVVSVDGAGQVNVYFPYRGEGSAPVGVSRPLELPAGSIVLDRAPGPERVFAVFSAQPLAAEPVRRLLEGLGRRGPDAIRRETRLELPGTLQMSLFFEKAERQP